ncbi:Gfo/Idh/MocA family protein [Arthrobacter castelli]|uniref:Gfo/Idh/MocA family protein n=1 Tax=Arthrobacter castelli TaxID=271431 RepID=UPI00040BF8C4|nr:Gfo/Idh/MocA family oxidoreductase [Arthrobacter castelli]
MSEVKQPFRAAVVGAGGIARGNHLPALRAEGDRVEVVALVDINTELLSAAAEQFGVPGRYTDLYQMLQAEAPDMVVVCTPPVAHRDAVVASLDAGAWVWCEKPPALSLAEYDEMSSHERADGPYACYVFQQRFGSGAQRLRRHVTEGTLGRPLIGICNTLWYRDGKYFEVPWRGRWDTEGGGPTMGHGIHQMDLLVSVLGDWREVTAEMSTAARDVETEDVSCAIVRFESGAVVSVTNSLLSPRETSYLRFDFDDATVELEHLYGYDNSCWKWTAAPHRLDPDQSPAWQPEQDLASSHRAQLSSLLDSMERGERPLASGRDGRRVLELIAGMYKSAITRRTVKRTDINRIDPFYRSMKGGTMTPDAPFEYASVEGALHA